jgi:hypothetical protein
MKNVKIYSANCDLAAAAGALGTASIQVKSGRGLVTKVRLQLTTIDLATCHIRRSDASGNPITDNPTMVGSLGGHKSGDQVAQHENMIPPFEVAGNTTLYFDFSNGTAVANHCEVAIAVEDLD